MDESYLKESKILIVDDQQPNVEILEGLLEFHGYSHIKSTTDSREVMSLYVSFKPDLILLDLAMPFLSGFDVMELLKTIVPSNVFLPILVLTADVSQESKQRALSLGASDFITKPFDVSEVSLRIKNLLFTNNILKSLENQNQILEEKVKERTQYLEKANLELEKANNELLVLDKAKLDFLKLISHEIRTPLNGILGFAELLKMEIQSPDLLEYLLYLENSALRLERFSYKALLITELRTKQAILHFKSTSLKTLYENSYQKLKDTIEAKKIKVIFQTEMAPEKIVVDEKLIQLCFDGLLDNAVKYSFDNETILVKVYSKTDEINIEFIDKGSGFSDLALHILYDIFSLGDEHVDKNIGLTMALIKLIMETHKGRIEVQNNEIQGACVKLVFPSN